MDERARQAVNLLVLPLLVSSMHYHASRSGANPINQGPKARQATTLSGGLDFCIWSILRQGERESEGPTVSNLLHCTTYAALAAYLLS